MNERVTVRIPREDMDVVRRLVDEGVYANNSEAIRDALRSELQRRRSANLRR